MSLCHEQTLRTAPPTQSRTKPFQPSVGKCNVAANAAKKSMRTAYPCSAHLLVTRSTARMPGVLTSSHFLESWRSYAPFHVFDKTLTATRPIGQLRESPSITRPRPKSRHTLSIRLGANG